MSTQAGEQVLYQLAVCPRHPDPRGQQNHEGRGGDHCGGLHQDRDDPLTINTVDGHRKRKKEVASEVSWKYALFWIFILHKLL